MSATEASVDALRAERDNYRAALEMIMSVYHSRDVTDREELRRLPFEMKEIALRALVDR